MPKLKNRRTLEDTFMEENVSVENIFGQHDWQKRCNQVPPQVDGLSSFRVYVEIRE